MPKTWIDYTVVSNGNYVDSFDSREKAQRYIEWSGSSTAEIVRQRHVYVLGELSYIEDLD